MRIIKMLKEIRNNYVIRQVKKANIPEFELDHTARYHLVFSGRVQYVGFRLEIQQLALRLGLTGWIKNLENGDVEMEIQGMNNRIDFLLNFMNSLIRIKINRMEKDTVRVLEQEKEFRIL